MLDLQIMEYALRWLWLKQIDNTRTWSSIFVQQENLVQAMFEASMKIEVGDVVLHFFGMTIGYKENQLRFSHQICGS